MGRVLREKEENKMKKLIKTLLVVSAIALLLAGCDFETQPASSSGSKADTQKTIEAANSLQDKQPTPTDIEYSIPRWLLSRRAYFVNGQREKARTLPCPVADVPLGHIVLLTDSGAIVGKFIVEGMVISLNTYLTPDSEYYEKNGSSKDGNLVNKWLADIDGTYGINDNGIFFFTPTGLYMEWSGTYLYTDSPVIIEDPIVRLG